MTELLILRGAPATGKTTVAEELVLSDGYVRVNRDDIRRSMYGRSFGPPIDEKVVTDVENAMIQSTLRSGVPVVSDATNLNNKLLRTKQSLASGLGVPIRYQDFEEPLEVAVYRDGFREHKVGRPVIERFFRQFKINPDTGALRPPPAALPEFERHRQALHKPSAYIVDTDGTLANHEGVRSPYDTSRYHLDTLHAHVAAIVNALHEDHQIILLSGRSEEFADVTKEWYATHGINYDKILMRAKGDSRMDAIVKYELFKKHIEPNYWVMGALDDRPQVIRMWQRIGVPVLNAGTGEEF